MLLLAASGTLAALSFNPAQAGDEDAPVRIVVFGDSLAAGYGLPPGEGFSERLGEWAAERWEGVSVENAGVSGDTTAGGLARLDWTLTPPPDAVILELGANDALRGIQPSETRANLDAMLARLGEAEVAVLLAGMLAPRNMGEDYVRAFEAIYPELAEAHDVILLPFFLEGVAAEPALNQADGIHPNAAGVAIMVENIKPAVEVLVARARE